MKVRKTWVGHKFQCQTNRIRTGVFLSHSLPFSGPLLLKLRRGIYKAMEVDSKIELARTAKFYDPVQILNGVIYFLGV